MICGGRASDLSLSGAISVVFNYPISTASHFHVILIIAVVHICCQTPSKIEI